MTRPIEETVVAWVALLWGGLQLLEEAAAPLHAYFLLLAGLATATVAVGSRGGGR